MKQYTAGTLAELAGVSARTVRYYDTKGILRPTGYTESGYRLYDDAALLKMQQISMLKFAGFSLEEIQGMLIMEDRAIPDILEDQRQLLLERRDKIDEVIELLGHVLEQENYSDLSQLTGSMKLIRSVNHSGRRYRFFDQHSDQKLYPWEFDQLDLKPGMKTLDLGCGYGLLWRQSWQRIPENSEVTLVDIYGRLLEEDRKFADEHRAELSAGTALRFVEDDAETYPMESGYDRIVMAFLWKYLREPEKLLEKSRDALSPKGCLVLIHGNKTNLMEDCDRIYQEFAGDYCLPERISLVQASEETVTSALRQVFPRVETVIFDNELTFTHALELYRFMMDSYEELTAAIKAQGIGFVNFLRRHVEERGTVTLHDHVVLFRCWKEDTRADS